MSKTGKQIELDVYRLLSESHLSSIISGSVYREGMRPRDSKKEDAVVMFSSGLSNQIETGVVTINIFVPDQDFYENGQLLEDGERTSFIEIESAKWVDTLTCGKTNYKFKLRQTITTDYEPETHEHFVVIILGYEYYDKG